MKLTLDDIGRMAGVSRATVSRVVNGDANVRPDVRQRVQDVVRRTGYSPDEATRSLASSRTGVIGLVIPSRVHDLFADPYFSRLIQGISGASNRAGTTLSLFLFQTDEEERELFPRVVESGFVDGMIITATRMGDPLLVSVQERGMPLVMIGRPDVEGVSYVDVDNRGGAREVALHLTRLGHRRIAFIGAPSNTTAGLDRHDGFVEGLAEAGSALDPALHIVGDYTESSGFQAMHRLIPHRPDAVFVASDTMAMGALRALQEKGLVVPDDVALVGFDDISEGMSKKWLTTVRQPVADTGRRSVELLGELVDSPGTAPRAEILPVELVVRQSCGAAAADEETDGQATVRTDRS